ncbi:MAG TPA: hypothetical protein VMU76_12490 [Acidimicrobiales bacterium]|nr:hypothetical protein [Acidimicrobiales bacterium]
MRDGVHDPHSNGQLDPLLRELLDFGLVELDPSDGSWHLSESARQRLSLLAVPPPPAEKIVYFGHRCTSCGQIRPTRFRAEGYVCDECTGRAPVADWVEPLPRAPGLTA